MYSTLQFGSLRPIRDSELELMLSWRNEPSVRQNMYTTHEIGLEEHLAWWATTKDSPRHRYFMYEYEGRPAGIVGFTGIDRGNQNASWAFYASPEAPKGSGSRMEVLALDYAFGELGLHKLSCEVLAFNTSVIRLHEKFGFQVEGVLRDQHKRGDEFIDVYRLGLLCREWADARDEMIAKLTRLSKG
ncbi:UDP-4-amino-4,6-dideoxy-N-acetyl-beta-L-altrosamine N-acetyltransferase [Marinobacter pelagius]|uniref:UDP-4-amino-4,6-dideoxy-N-acetyl-beta-L-altrosamine N-acetyltransferase n=1 Tax=Marinobacter pelagius TaxID=379482 RepID=A0A1I4TZ24_9GAMM|nr:UDP-4-amino-4,6-dideoxy-N-acetyl-beta-L-altrosamine N-acetyltransferase [Marinobacter pelagius]SFM81877.1 UDP-4-amino-4,6-dideoxy-N-acetyl-beta-L-altrosamine N-acetyltransferase [Marinobacter pelagius]